MVQSGPTGSERSEIARLRDEVEQLQTALESSAEEVSRLAEDRSRLLRRVTALARELHTANAAYSAATLNQQQTQGEASATFQIEQDQEELRVAFEEMQVLTEELESANDTLRQTNSALDQLVAERTSELAAKNLALTESELRFRTLVEGIPQLVWRAVDGGHWTWTSPQWTEYTGLSTEESTGFGWLEALHPDDREAASRFWHEAAQSGHLEMESRIRHAASQDYHWFQIRATPVRDKNNAILEWLGTSTDVHELRAMQERQQVMVAELQHRTRNLIGVIHSISQQTMTTSDDLESFRETFNERLAALSRVQGLLSGAHEQRVTIAAILRSELDAFGADVLGDRITLHGPDVPLRNSVVQTLALALHELATNARKYGALAASEGRLHVAWTVRTNAEEPRRLDLSWVERGVQMPQEQQSTLTQSGGYGRELIEHALPYSLGAETTFEIAPDGVRCTISLPLDKQSPSAAFGKRSL